MSKYSVKLQGPVVLKAFSSHGKSVKFTILLVVNTQIYKFLKK